MMVTLLTSLPLELDNSTSGSCEFVDGSSKASGFNELAAAIMLDKPIEQEPLFATMGIVTLQDQAIQFGNGYQRM